MSASHPDLILVDGSSFLFRAFHALPPLTTRDGRPTGALHGVANMLKKLMADESPTHMAVVFDAPGPTFRDEIYPEYKAHRPPMPEDLRVQIEPLHALVRAMGLPLLLESGVEADDVIATLARQAVKAGHTVMIASSDKDLAQLVGPRIVLVDTMQGRRLDEAGVLEKFGVPPERMVDYLTLVGDSVDNVPGVSGCGPKTAQKWLSQYGSLDTLVARADEVGGKIGERLRESLSSLPLSRELVTVREDVPLPLGPDDLRVREPEREALLALCREYGLNSWLRQLEGVSEKQVAPVAPADDLFAETPSPVHEAEGASRELQARAAYALIDSEAALAHWLARLMAAPQVALDTETSDLNYLDARIVGLSFAVAPGEAAYLPLAHEGEPRPVQLPLEPTLARLRPWLEDERHLKVLQNAKYDAHVFANHGITLAGVVHDSMLESYVLDSTATRHNMDSLAARYLGWTTLSYEDVAGKGAKQIPFSRVPVDVARAYAGEDADVTLRLHETLWPQLEALPGLRAVYETLEMPLISVLQKMERAGVLIDAAGLMTQGHWLGERLAQIERQAHEVAGRAFNLASPKQLQVLLFEELGLKPGQRTATGQASTNEEALEELAEHHPLPRLILEHRALAKLKSTYVDRLPAQIHPRTGRVHTSYHQAVTSTGRLSSSDPNLQNIPARTPEGRRIRQAFIAPPGAVLLSADYSQIELRIMAHLSGDEGLLRAFAEGRDIHRATAAEVFAVDESQVGADQRRAAKAINFGLIYGMSAFGLARQLGIGRNEAQAYVERYFERYPGVLAYMDRTREQARAQGFVETVDGRRLYLPEIRSRNAQRRQYAERTAINAPMQGTAADIIKRAMIDIDAWLTQSGAPARMIMQVHDELVFEVDAAHVDELREQITRRMSAAAGLSVPLTVEVGVGDNWDAAH
ncbi:MAG: DNA polymerase I [Halothiobacillaceae bacterium]|nr:DNA polymerase I [Halothiobacillaceae bacterium]